MAVLSERNFEFQGAFYKIVKVSYSGKATTFKVSQTATAGSVIDPASGGPSVSIGSADSNFEKTVTLAAGGSAPNGFVIVVFAHSGATIGTSAV